MSHGCDDCSQILNRRMFCNALCKVHWHRANPRGSVTKGNEVEPRDFVTKGKAKPIEIKEKEVVTKSNPYQSKPYRICKKCGSSTCNCI